MQLCVHSMALPDLNALQGIELTASIGYSGIDLIVSDGFSCAISPTAAAQEIRQLKRYAADCGICVAALTPYVSEIWVEGSERRGRAIDELKNCIDVALELGAGSVRVLAGMIRPDANEWAGAFDRTVSSLKTLAEHVKGEKLALTLENHANSMSETSAETAKIVAAVDDPRMGILYDPTNLYCYGESDYLSNFSIQGPYIRHVHIKDFRRFSGTAFAPVLMGEGDMPWAEIIRLLRKAGYDRFLSVEYEKRWHYHQLPDSPTGLRHELKSIKELLGQS